MRRTAASEKPPAPERSEGFIPSGADRATRLAAVALAWGIFQHFYPYFDVVENDWLGALRQALRAAASDPDARAFLATLRRMVAELGDGHGHVQHASNPNTGHLPLLWNWIEDQLVVTLVAPESTADLRPGDAVLAVDGKPALSALAEREALISGATLQWRRYRSLGELAMGRVDQEMHLEVASPAGERRTVTLKATLPLFGEGSLREQRPEQIDELRPGIFYLDLGRITDEDFRGAVDQLAQAQGIVFDLRGYPRLSTIVIAHLIDEPVSSARWNVPVVTRPDREDMTFDFSNWWVMPEAPRLTAKVAFLTDGRAISYAETYLGIIEHYRLAEIVGSPTAGTNGNVNPFTLPGAYWVAWTGMQVLKHDGSRHHGVGIQPTILVARTRRGVAEGRDEVLERALEVVSTATEEQKPDFEAADSSQGVDQTVDLTRARRRMPASQEVVAWIHEHAIPLATPEAEQGFDDLRPVRELIGDARVVGLGEATHGTREFFQLKHRMLEFLVEEMGFTVFAI
ncbi:MAG: hypothetical protein GY856_31070, partial [bacterium]|nr:hypothetical protein [bacterium]